MKISKDNLVVPGRTERLEHRVSFVIAESVWKELSDIANENACSVSDIIRDAIALELFLQRCKVDGFRVGILDDNEFQELDI